MTNYNERLDKILDRIEELSLLVSAENSVTGSNVYGSPSAAVNRAKQAITSLIKELVAEAKPEVPEEYERDDALSVGFTRGTEYYYDAISNLLKALEEV